MKAEFSEFSYGFALTHELANSLGSTLVGAPVFPSLVQEGGLGYDLSLPLEGAPHFFQFKLSDHMVRSTAKGSDLLGVPHFRMPLRSRRYSQQHDLLVALEQSGRNVFYAAPEFHSLEELNVAFTSQNVANETAFLSPSDIGTWEDNEEHFVAFQMNSDVAYRFSSNPHRVRLSRLNDIRAKIRRQEPTLTSAQQYFEQLGNEMIEIWVKVTSFKADRTDESRDHGPTINDLQAEEREAFPTLGMKGASFEETRLIESIQKARSLGSLTFVTWVAQVLYGCSLFAPLSRHQESQGTLPAGHISPLV